MRTDDDGVGGPSILPAQQSSTQPRRVATGRQLFRRILRGQQIIGTLIGIIGIPTALVTGYSAVLSLKPEVAATLRWSRNPADRTIFVQNAGARPLYHYRMACILLEPAGPGMVSPLQHSHFDSPPVPPGTSMGSSVSGCNIEVPNLTDPEYVVVALCYKDQIPFHQGFGLFTFKRNYANKPDAPIGFVNVDPGDDVRITQFSYAVSTSCKEK